MYQTFSISKIWYSNSGPLGCSWDSDLCARTKSYILSYRSVQNTLRLGLECEFITRAGLEFWIHDTSIEIGVWKHTLQVETNSLTFLSVRIEDLLDVHLWNPFSSIQISHSLKTAPAFSGSEITKEQNPSNCKYTNSRALFISR